MCSPRNLSGTALFLYCETPADGERIRREAEAAKAENRRPIWEGGGPLPPPPCSTCAPPSFIPVGDPAKPGDGPCSDPSPVGTGAR